MDGALDTLEIRCNFKLVPRRSRGFIKNQAKLAIVKWGRAAAGFMEVEGAFEDTDALILRSEFA